MNKIIYQGLFVNPTDFNKLKELVEKSSIEEIRYGEFLRSTWTAKPHITWAFRPADKFKLPESIWGQKINVRITHIGFYKNPKTGLVENIGVKADKSNMLPFGNYITNDMDNLHITLKTSNGGKPVNTGKCQWYPIPPVKIRTVAGVFADDGNIWLSENLKV